MKIFVGVLIIFIFLLSIFPLTLNKTYFVIGKPAIAQNLPAAKTLPPVSKSYVRDYVRAKAKESGVNPVVADWIVKKESDYNPRAIGDDGVSIGAWQFNIEANPQISSSCALNLECSTKLAMQWIIASKANLWSTMRYCKLWYEDCPFP